MGTSASVMPMSSPWPSRFSGIEQAEGEAEQRRLGGERDVALVPGEPDAERLLAFVRARA